MRRILCTQRVDSVPGRAERRDALDQAWSTFLLRCGLLPIPVPNVPEAAEALMDQVPFDGVLLTGGNDLASYGGDAPERDQVERSLLKRALDERRPVLGVCRGMQLLLDAFDTPLVEVPGHVSPRQEIEVDGAPAMVNSYHRWGCREVGGGLQVWARASDGVVKAVRHPERRLVGIMWHPERMDPLREEDVALFREQFSEGAA
ncbi:MAG: type 1 glutamine amidotransferase [Myxococcota bacterium]